MSAPPTTAASQSLQSGFDEALSDFKKKLSSSELNEFQVATLDDLKVTILTIQKEQRARKQMAHMDRIRPFLEAMEQFGKVIEIFLNATDFLAFVWGPIKLLLLDNPPMQTVLRCIWSDILNFHIRALRIFQQPPIRTFFKSLWKDFNSRFQHILGDLKRQKALVESHANHIHIQNYESDRLQIREEFEQDRARRFSEWKAYVMQWIAASRFILDHEALCSIREEQFKDTNRRTAQWVLQHDELKAWIASQVPKSSILWLSGIAGVGKSILTSVVVDEIKGKQLGPIAYFYCKYRDPDKHSFVSIMKGLLSQLAFLIVDGIDECDLNERKLALDYFRDILNLCDSSKPGKVRLFISGRDESDIRRALSMGTRIRVDQRDTLQDLEVYIAHGAGMVQKKFDLSTEARQYVQQNVLDRADGMFLVSMKLMGEICAESR
ncbi:hypothetical protein ABKA04_008180 [Annulohypoxylon sp. FPYF3050]